ALTPLFEKAVRFGKGVVHPLPPGHVGVQSPVFAFAFEQRASRRERALVAPPGAVVEDAFDVVVGDDDHVRLRLQEARTATARGIRPDLNERASVVAEAATL